MPELPEVDAMVQRVNEFCKGRHFEQVIKSDVNKNPAFHPPFDLFSIHSVRRGKEMKLTFSQASPPTDATLAPMEVVMGMGMTGQWKFITKAEVDKASDVEELIPKHTHLRFVGSDGALMLFIDSRRFGKWHVGTWSEKRSPDLVTEFDDFCEFIRACFFNPSILRSFERSPIGEVLMKQQYFNGIGNYLRAEILLRAHLHPLECTKKALLLKEPLKKGKPAVCGTDYQTFDFTKSLVLRLCRDVCQEVINRNNSACPKGDWLKCYQAEGAHSMRDNQGRTMWYRDDQYYIDAEFPGKCSGSRKGKVKRENPTSDDESYGDESKRAIQKETSNERRSPRLLKKRNSSGCFPEESPLKKSRVDQ